MIRSSRKRLVHPQYYWEAEVGFFQVFADRVADPALKGHSWSVNLVAGCKRQENRLLVRPRPAANDHPQRRPGRLSPRSARSLLQRHGVLLDVVLDSPRAARPDVMERFGVLDAVLPSKLPVARQ